jgi:hypothetical protein
MQQAQENTSEWNELRHFFSTQQQSQTVDNATLKQLAQDQQTQNLRLKEDLQELQSIVQAFRDGKYNESEGAQLLITEQVTHLNQQLKEQDTVI